MNPAVGVLTLELQVSEAHSLKDKRHVVKSLKDRLRTRFNVSVAEIAGQDTWQYSVVAVVTVSGDRARAAQVLEAVEREAESVLGGMLASTGVEWLS